MAAEEPLGVEVWAWDAMDRAELVARLSVDLNGLRGGYLDADPDHPGIDVCIRIWICSCAYNAYIPYNACSVRMYSIIYTHILQDISNT